MASVSEIRKAIVDALELLEQYEEDLEDFDEYWNAQDSLIKLWHRLERYKGY